MPTFWKVRGRSLSLNQTLLMGIVNVTPDSFSDGGEFFTPDAAAAQCFKLAEEGADLLDLGAESTRPGAKAITAEEELRRLLPVLEKITPRIPALISIDTTKAQVARVCLERGAHIINDVSGLKDSGEDMAAAVREFEAGLILMHRRGNPETMQNCAVYGDVVNEVFSELETCIEQALVTGIRREQLAIDPGLGFAKTADQNWEIIAALEKFQEMGLPVVLGPSRKSFLSKLTGREPKETAAVTAAVCTIGVLKKVQILRIHDVAQVSDAVKVSETINSKLEARNSKEIQNSNL